MPPVDDAEPHGARRRGLWALSVCAALPFALFFALRPERYSLTPNSLDPVFYTGYASNFDDVMNAVGDRHYFVTRWTAYYPVYLLDHFIGPLTSRLVWRWFVAGLMVMALLELGRRLGWRRSVGVLVSVLVLSTPMFLRAYLTDYVEYLVVGLGVCLVVLCLRERQTRATAAGIGLLGAAILIANPIAIFAVALAGLAALLLERGGWPRRMQLVLVSTLAATAVIGAGLLLFRSRYGIANVYEPSIRFARTYAGDPDAWKSPRLEWLGKFTWVYTPPVLLAVAAGMSIRRRVTWTRVELAALGLCAAQYAFQWVDQFVRDGFGLELSFYWSFVLPAYLVALAVVVARLCQVASLRSLAAIVAVWLLVLIVGVPTMLRLPAGWWFLLLAALAVAALIVAARQRPALGAGILVVGLLWMQIGAPHYDPSAYFFLNVSPRYDEVIWRAGDESDMFFDEAMWFAEQMDRVPNDASTSFISAGGWSSAISGLYAPHVTGRIIYPEQGASLAEQTIREIKSGFRPIVAIFGDQQEVAGIYADLASRTTVTAPVLDVTRDRGFRYRLVVLAMPDATRLPFTWTADVLPRVGGQVSGTDVIAAPPEPSGVLTYGPYHLLPPGRYTVTFRYRADAPGEVKVGTADASTLSGTPVRVIDLPGTDGRPLDMSIEFESTESAVWEFRSFWNGTAPLAIESITLSSSG